MTHDRPIHPEGVRSVLNSLARLMIVLVAADRSLWSLSPSAMLGQLSTARLPVLDVFLILALLSAWRYCFAALGLPGPALLSTSRKMLLAAAGCLLMTVPWIAYVVVEHSSSMVAIPCAFLLISLGYELSRILIASWIRGYSASRDPLRVLVVGSGRRASQAWRAIRTHYHGEVLLLGFVDNRSVAELAPDMADRYLGSIDELQGLLLREIVDTIVIAMPLKSCYGLMQQAIDMAEETGTSVVYLNDIFRSPRHHGVRAPRLFDHLLPVHQHVVLQQKLKRAIDIMVAFSGLTIGSPLLLGIALAIKASSPGQLFVRQECLGHRRRPFHIIRFRSLAASPSERQSAEGGYPLGQPVEPAGVPSITRFGKSLRVLSIDALPQLWNVLVGDMSLVGPRPLCDRDIPDFDNASLVRRFSVKPGLTGLWQVSHRNGITFSQRIAYDSHYIDRWSLSLDFKILMRAFSVVMKRSSAM